MTNFEKIKDMTVNEIADFLVCGCVTTAQLDFCSNCQKEHNNECVTEGFCLYSDWYIMKWWLEQPAEKGESECRNT